ncbi:6-pyruvoyl tetrahydropterin synthase [Cylindrospermopsis raciborskii CENA303]|uniref:6-carboxy-5,6,7,8-tetrahydropterin synthase n=1 Tax=Cylindrospermopsis raciborskii CENA303 TaxID=1170769 RepID=A0A1X4G8H6_9CYAN|nr:6-carboxytetrahydropterin synthase [Cylindrospermopsis raciborskii]MCZ2201261.1 6-carboxytetrahydropterin synthase [Cylindrospermopsis raciborskii PAMP2012]OSO92862.1 6-pyruvoyl tetrahydropterin synthase [Cylindrospermopsis raciborskii CENA303]
MECIINRRAQFSASHRYWLPELGEAQNVGKFGLCAKFPGHGHNYVLFISMSGELDEYGMVLNLSDVKQVIKSEVTSELDFSYLNEVWEEFQATLPTTENIARVIWNRLTPHLPLVRVQLFQHPQLWTEYEGKGEKVSLTARSHFSAAHRLAPNLSAEKYGKCTRTHGHNYHLEVTVEGEMDGRTGMIVDLGCLHETVEREILELFDHSCINEDIPYFSTSHIVPTTENIARYMSDLLQFPISELGVKLSRVKLFESDHLWVEYEGKDSEIFFSVATGFSAAHRLADPTLSLEKNQTIYGKCSRINGHGHNYHLEVTVRGEIDSVTGMSVDLVGLNQIIQHYVIEPMDHSFLNQDLPYFTEVVPTAENIAVYISDVVRSPIEELGAKLHKVKLIESPNNSCEIYAKDIEESRVDRVDRELAVV